MSMNEALLERLQRLAKLYQMGKVSDEEFKKSKAKLIAGKFDESAVAGLERLAKLSGDGGLSEDEFTQLKAAILKDEAKSGARESFGPQQTLPRTGMGVVATLAVITIVAILGWVAWEVVLRNQDGLSSAFVDPGVKLEANLNQEDGLYSWVGEIVIVNKGDKKIVIEGAQVNNKTDKGCVTTERKTLSTGDSYAILSFSCGRVVKVLIKTNRGDVVFNW